MRWINIHVEDSINPGGLVTCGLAVTEQSTWIRRGVSSTGLSTPAEKTFDHVSTNSATSDDLGVGVSYT